MQQTYDSLLDRYLANLRLMKTYRGMSDNDIAIAGAFGTRQAVSLRTRGMQMPNLLDLIRFGAAFNVEPTMLLAPPGDLLAWAQAHPDYQLVANGTAGHRSPTGRPPRKGRAQPAATATPRAVTKKSGRRARTSPGASSPRRAAS